MANHSDIYKMFHSRSSLLMLIVVALFIDQTPVISNFFRWQATFFHEISHGLAALATGGNVHKIEVNFSGAGLCHTSGGVRWAVSLAGYMGTALWGLLVYFSAEAVSKKHAYILAVFIITVLAATELLYAKDFQSWLIISIIAVIYGGAIKFREKISLKLFLKLAGLYMVVDSLKSPIALLRHHPPNDAASLAAQTGLPEFIWIVLWVATALVCLASIWQIDKKPEQTCKAEQAA